ncbi:TIGR02678 family protein [Rhodococcus sp. SGAir0479]|uniref:TIGR02678 family protein n=1 Tax=Rhodococcus sp. SGAir0479 TaxID=2567884 RepID=UPI0010CCDAC9|nr:TIGR02678 family protein [Rhodococcus sp. SGAir0479]QCQ91059.1 TIGR02678 family protein [Rhodococcus sp. SGAir0479]
MRARTVSPLDLDSYQRAARVILSNHLVTQTYPDRLALPLLRRWATELRDDLLDLFGYRLEVTETTARLFTVADRLTPGTPARTATDRTFDRHRYAYLALALAALGRAGNQITLSELAEHVATEAAQVPGVTLSTDRAADRDAFVDAVGWLAARGAIVLADGDAGGWASNPGAGEALYDIDRSVVVALFRPPRALQHLTSARSLLAGEQPGAEDEVIAYRPADQREVARRIRRALVERPVVYADELTDDERLQLALPRTAADVEELTGLVAERRAEGIAMIDPSGRMSDVRFPSTGTVSQVALLLAGEMADRVLDPDAPALPTRPLPDSGTDALIAQLDAAIPRHGVFEQLADEPADTVPPAEFFAPADDSPDPVRYALLDDAWLTGAVDELVHQFGRTFAAQWQADHTGLRRSAVALLDRLDLIRTVDDGVLVLPAIARFRGVVVNIRERTAQSDLFHDPVPGGPPTTAEHPSAEK